MSDMREAFTKAGLPVHAVAFASACHDLSILALNREADPRRAVHAWLGMAGGMGFRRALEEYLAAIAKEREVTKSVGGAGQIQDDARETYAQPPTEPNADAVAANAESQDRLTSAASVGSPNSTGGEGRNAVAAQATTVLSPVEPVSDGGVGQTLCDAHSWDAQPPSDPERERVGQKVSDTQKLVAASLAPRSPSPEQIRAVTAAKAASARVMSGIYITERQGSRTLLDDITVASLDRRLQWQGGRVAKDALEYNTLWLVKEQIKRQAFIPEGAAVGDVIEAEGLRQLHGLARAFARSPMVQLPEQLRGPTDAEAA